MWIYNTGDYMKRYVNYLNNSHKIAFTLAEGAMHVVHCDNIDNNLIRHPESSSG